MSEELLMKYIIGIVVTPLFLYYWFLRKSRRPSNYLFLAHVYDMVWLRKKAIATLETALHTRTVSDKERADLLVRIGMYHLDLKDNSTAVDYFDQFVEAAMEVQFYYDSKFLRIVEAYQAVGQQERAVAVYRQLLARASFDPDFRKLKRLEGKLGIQSTL
ncbi:tetratricopeptide repeat protein [Paenibacillus sp. GCM10023252]|uniref:tetratricopeptide repeat protein n=1 Tax=Paenibacillus sp. GCM10023252 TaxID=3252649 RepID=UPI00361D6448